MYGFNTNVEADVRRLERELEDARYQEGERVRNEERDREIRANQSREERMERLHFPETWEQAWPNGLMLFRREAAQEAADNRECERNPEFAHMVSNYFQGVVPVIERGQVIYNEVMAEVEKQIVALRAGALNQVADRLIAEYGDGDTAASGLSNALRANDHLWLTNW